MHTLWRWIYGLVTAASVSTAISFTAGPAASTTSTLVANPNSVVADGVGTTTLTALVADAQANPVPGATVAFAVSGGNNTLSAASATSNASGQASVTLKSTRQEVKTATATVGSVTATTHVAFVAGAASSVKSSLVISPTAQLTANGNTMTTATLSVADAFGNAVGNQNLTLSVSGSNNTLTAPAPWATDANTGKYLATLTSTKAETKTVTAVFAGITKTASVTFVPGPAALPYTSISASPNANVWASNQVYSNLGIVIADANNNVISNQNYTLSVSGSNNTLAPSAGMSNSLGQAAATLASKTWETKTVTLTAGSAVASTQVGFIRGVYAPLSSLSASPTSAPADNNTVIGLSLNANDSLAAPFGAGRVSWTSSVTGVSFSPAASTTSAAGMATSNARAIYAGNANLIANVAGATLAVPVSFAPRTAYCNNANVALRPGRPGPSLLNESGYQALAAVDLNKDGLLDLIAIDNTGYLRAARGSGGGAFTAPYTYGNASTGTTNTATLVPADFDNDTHIDVAAGNQNAILIAYGAGNGQTKSVVSLSATPSSYIVDVRAADLNNDGLIDIVATDSNNNQIGLFLNQSGQSFATPIFLATGRSPQSAAVADFNQDGNMDIAAINNTDATLQVFNNLGNATFGTAATYASSTGPTGLAVGNVNSDAYPDIVVASGGNTTLALFTNNGAGGFAASTSIASATTYNKVYLVDIDGDHNLDVVGTVVGQSNRIFWGLGTGSFNATASITPAALGTQSLAFGDINGDGTTDIITATSLSRAAALTLNANNRTWVTQPMYPLAGLNSSRLVTADLNRDGATDILATSRYGGGGVTTLKGSGDGNFRTSWFVAYSNYINDIRVADLNGDGWLDFAYVVVPTSVMQVYLNNQDANATFTLSASYPTRASPNGLALVDINNDGATDAVTANNSNSISVFVNNGNALFGTPTHYALGAVSYVVALDIDADGFQDLAVLGFNNLYILRNNGDTSFSLVSNTPLYEGLGMLAADVDMDGREDLILSQGYATYIIAWINQGNNTFAFLPGIPVNYSYSDLEVSDVNGDGYLDVLCSGGAALTILTGDGTGHFHNTTYTAWGGANYIATGDFDGDGRMDIATCGNAPSSINAGPSVSILLYKGCDTTNAN